MKSLQKKTPWEAKSKNVTGSVIYASSLSTMLLMMKSIEIRKIALWVTNRGKRRFVETNDRGRWLEGQKQTEKKRIDRIMMTWQSVSRFLCINVLFCTHFKPCNSRSSRSMWKEEKLKEQTSWIFCFMCVSNIITSAGTLSWLNKESVL